MSIVRVGSNQQYSDNWDNIFTTGKKRKTGKKKSQPKQSPKKKSAKKKSSAKKAVKKKPASKKKACKVGKKSVRQSKEDWE